ncbi:MAG: family 78 glycoside hydrolase catalytic domain [bacterium]|nr:family 78 glycoside hydrolase catalytic domain [bacterium]
MFGAKWIWDEEIPQNNSNRNILCYFRKRFYVKKTNCEFYIKVTADSRYKLYINGYPIGFGPEKGDRWRYYFDTIKVNNDLLREGWNVISALVIHYYVAEPWIYYRGGPGSVFRTATAGFLLEGELIDENNNLIDRIITDESWKVFRNKGIEFIPSRYMPLVGEVELVKGELIPYNWHSIDFDDTTWKDAKIILKDRDLAFNPEVKLNELLPNWSLVERDIPILYQEDKNFIRVIPESFSSSIILEPNRSYSFILDAGELTTAFPCVKVRGGKGSVIKLTYGECFSYSDSNGILKKDIRDDTGGIIIGDTDTFYPSGNDDYYEPFWFRTFRFIKIDVNVSSSPISIDKIWFREVGYPLSIDGSFSCSDERLNKVLDVSVRTLKRSIHETYEDCPYYEQMQYIMDSMLEALYTYQISKDYRLVRKALYDFHSSLLPTGLLQSRYPSVAPQVIPIFSLYWILMLRDYVLYSGDIELIRRYRPTIDSILGWFERYLLKEDLIGRIGYWPYIDWVDGWNWGIPPAFNSDIATIYSLIYSYTLKIASNLMLSIGSRSLFREYKIRSMKIDKAIKKYCWDEEIGLFKDGIKTRQFSQHCQIWAVLNELVKSDMAKSVIEKAIENRDISRVSISHSYFLFRALDKTGLYNKYGPVLLNRWKELLDMNITTFPETFENPRSECHGWSAVPIYEFMASILGIRPSEPGFRKVDIKPHPINLDWAEGIVPTLRGDINIRWEKGGDSMLINLYSPKGMKIRLILSALDIFSPILFINEKEVSFRNLIELPGGKYRILVKKGMD